VAEWVNHDNNQTFLFFVIAVFMVTLLSLYNTYKFWFDADNFQKQSLKRAKNTPAFPQVKNYAVQKIKNKRA
jgi:hypothetical protein